MMKAALPLPKALSIIVEETQNKRLKAILKDIQYGLEKGQSLSAGFARFPEVFDPIFITITKAGEESGTLEQTFDYLGEQLMSSYELSQKVKGALAYPAVVITAMMGVGLLMFTFVLPKIGQVFASLPNLKVPRPTLILLKVSTWVGAHNIFVLGSFVGLIVALILALRYRPTRQLIVGVLAKLPVLSRLFNQLDLARFCRTLSVLLKSGVPILDALAVASQTLSQKAYQHSAKSFAERIKKGVSFSAVLEEHRGVFPPIMIQTIKAGEESGTLDVVLLDLALFYEKEVENTLKRFVSLLEPALMLAIGVAVGAMVISVITPIYSVVGQLQGQGSRF